MRLLLLSNSRNAGTGYLEHARGAVDDFLGDAKRIAFIPYAAVRFSYDAYEAMVAGGMAGRDVVSVHRSSEPVNALKDADAVAVGGGNTFQLVNMLYRTGLMAAIHDSVQAGMPFMGWSAGSNVACPTLRTTNDMPIVEPESFRTLGLVPFQLNPHYLDAHPDGHMGETREERLLEFLALNPDVPVIGLREGALLRREGSKLELLGTAGGRIMRHAQDAREIQPGARLDDLLG